MSQDLFIKAIEIDDEDRIVVKVQEAYQHFLKEDFAKKMLRETASKALGHTFVELAVSTSTFRIQVEAGQTQAAVAIVEEEISKNIEMAMTFLNGFKM